MMEQIAQTAPMLLLAGWMAEAISRARGYGLMPDLMLGLVGSVVVGVAVWLAGGGFGMLATFAVGYAGAALAIVAQRTVWRSARLGT